MSTSDGNSGEDALMFEARHGCHRKIFNLMAQGINIHAKDDLERTALILSTVSKDIRNTLVLLRGGGDMKDSDVGGDTPLHWAVHHNNVPVARLLLKKGADMEKRNEKGQTPLCVALEQNDPLMIDAFDYFKSKRIKAAFNGGIEGALSVRAPLAFKPHIKLKARPKKPL